MDVNPQGLKSDKGEVEGLALVLRALTEPRDPGQAYDDFCACLGVSVSAVAVAGDVPPQAWPTFGRDVFLEQAARAWGLRLRNLHPPDVGVDMARAEEFDQHFELSYKPLICRAIENDQPVIAWRGWENEAVPSWGIVTAIEGDAFAGFVAGGGTSTLAASAWQCYVVETCEPHPPSRQAMLEVAIEAGSGMLRGRQESRPARIPLDGSIDQGVACGIPAWTLWSERLTQSGEDRGYPILCEYLLVARRSAMRFWERIARESEHPHLVKDLVARCGDTVKVIEQLTDRMADGEYVKSPDSAEWIKLLKEAQRRDELLFNAFEKTGRLLPSLESNLP